MSDQDHEIVTPSPKAQPNPIVSTGTAAGLAGAILIVLNYHFGSQPPPMVAQAEGTLVTFVIGVIMHYVTRPKGETSPFLLRLRKKS